MNHKIASHYEMVKKYHPEYLEAVEKLGLRQKMPDPLMKKPPNSFNLQLPLPVNRKEPPTAIQKEP